MDAVGTLFALLWAGIAGVGVGCALLAYAVVPWQRLDGVGLGEVSPRTTRLTRLSVTAACLGSVPVAVGGWAMVGTVGAGFRSDPSLSTRVAVALPGEALVTLGLLWTFAGFAVPLPFMTRDFVATLIGRDGS